MISWQFAYPGISAKLCAHKNTQRHVGWLPGSLQDNSSSSTRKKTRRLVSNEKGAEYPISNKEFPISKEELERQDQTVFLHHWKLLVEHQTAQMNPISYKNTKAWHESD